MTAPLTEPFLATFFKFFAWVRHHRLNAIKSGLARRVWLNAHWQHCFIRVGNWNLPQFTGI